MTTGSERFQKAVHWYSSQGWQILPCNGIVEGRCTCGQKHEESKDIAVFNVARFLFEYHSHRFESLDLPQLPADRSDFDVHGALLDDKVQTNCNALHFALS